MSEIRVNNLSNESSTGGPTISGITTFSGTNFFVPPVGNTAQRPQDPQKGALRFNTDTKHLEYFRGDTIGWSDVEVIEAAPIGGRAVINLGDNTGGQTIDYITISTLGNAIDFGNLFSGRYGCAATSSKVRAVIFGGYGSNQDTVDFITMASTGDSVDALNLPVNHKYGAAFGNGTRACIAGSYYPAQINNISYVEIPTLGDSIDFGDLTVARRHAVGVSNNIRGTWGGGETAGGTTQTDTIDFVTIATTGNAQDFGN